MIGLFVHFSLILFVAIVSIGGCDGGGSGEDIIEPTPIPEPTPMPEPPESCSNCPCDFFSVPLTVECWVRDSAGPEFENVTPDDFLACQLFIPDTAGMNVSEGFANLGSIHDSCQIGPFQSDTCNAIEDFHGSLTQDELAGCRICLGQYATALNNTGVSVIGGPPYICDTQR